MARRHLLNIAKDCLRARNIKISEIVVQPLPVDVRRVNSRSEYPFYLRCECELTLAVKVVERLDAKVIAGQHQLLFSPIKNGKGEHSVELLDRFDAVVFVKTND